MSYTSGDFIRKYGSYASITALFDSPRKILRSLKKSHRLGSLQLDLVKQQQRNCSAER